ncbi:aryl-alcohol oxidase-like protein [Crassisporium funariophilum]|nr:aryl-alcohol oxidase-like protein [Crassisporium funariophilum]
MLVFVWFEVILSLLSIAEARVLDSVLEISKKYDFVIVGGGTAGCVLANRLSENPQVKILLIEAGGSGDGNENIVIPFLGVALPGTTVDWNYTTTPQSGLQGRSIPYTRGQVLGGSSSVNLLTWNRGSNNVWDRWAKITGDPGWSSNSIQEFYLKTSRIVPPADGRSTAGQIIPSAHGNGPVQVSLPGFPTELDNRVINASKQLGGRFPFTVDLNAGNTVGFSSMQSSIGQGKRSSAATAYLDPVINRTNLDVLLNTHATKIIQSGTVDGLPNLNTLEVASSPTGQRYRVTASKELILSAGVIGTPQLLLLSGVGPKSTLQAQGIPSVIDLPSVGQNLTDHPLLPNYFIVNSNQTFDAILRNPALFGADIQEYMATGQGLLVDSPGNTQGFMRLPNNSPIFSKFKDPSAGPLSAHTEFIFVDGFATFGPLTQPAEGNFMSLLTAVVSPVSRGTVRLATSNPFDQPVIDPAILSSDFDSFAMVQAMKDAQSFISSQPWSGFVVGPLGGLAEADTDEKKEAFARNFSVTVNHPVGTASMSPLRAKWGVVDPTLLLKGACGLRIVDASIFPVIPESHPQAVVYTVAERAAALIKARHGC